MDPSGSESPPQTVSFEAKQIKAVYLNLMDGGSGAGGGGFAQGW